MKVNKTWHEKNKMPLNPTFEQHLKWHLTHQWHCACRPVPPHLAEEMNRRGIRLSGLSSLFIKLS